MSEPKQQDKPFQISKWKVWEAYERVKANKGAAGVDEQSIAEFEADRDRNLYKIWNRMSSGSYFPDAGGEETRARAMDGPLYRTLAESARARGGRSGW